MNATERIPSGREAKELLFKSLVFCPQRVKKTPASPKHTHLRVQLSVPPRVALEEFVHGEHPCEAADALKVKDVFKG